MNPEEQRRAYQSFFQVSEAGKEFLQMLANLLESNHIKAENDPDHSRDFAQRSKGVREIISHIQSVTADQEKPTVST